MPVVLRIGTLVSCAAPPVIPSSDAQETPQLKRGLCGLLSPLVTETVSAPLGPATLTSPVASPNASIGGSSSRHSGRLPLKRLLRRSRVTEVDEPHAAPEMLMPMWFSQYLSEDTTCSTVVNAVSAAVDEQLVRGRLATSDVYIALDGMPSSWALRRFQKSCATSSAALPSAHAENAEDAAPGSSKQDSKKKYKGAGTTKKEAEASKKTRKGREKRCSRSSASCDSTSSSSSHCAGGRGARRDSVPHEAMSSAWCLCFQDAQGVFRYCGRYTPSTRDTATATKTRTKRSASSSTKAGTVGASTAPLGEDEPDVYLTQVPFIAEACVKAHRRLRAVVAATVEAVDAHTHSYHHKLSQDGERAIRERHNAASEAPYTLGDSQLEAFTSHASAGRQSLSGAVAPSLLAGLANSADEPESLTHARFTTDVQTLHFLAQPASRRPSAGLGADAGDTHATLPSPRRYSHGTATQGHRRTPKDLKFAMLYGVVLPLPVLLMLNPYVSAAEGTSTHRRSRWRRHETFTWAAAAHSHPASPASPNAARRPCVDTKGRRPRAVFAVSEPVEIPPLFNRDPVFLPKRSATRTKAVALAADAAAHRRTSRVSQTATSDLTSTEGSSRRTGGGGPADRTSLTQHHSSPLMPGGSEAYTRPSTPAQHANHGTSSPQREAALHALPPLSPHLVAHKVAGDASPHAPPLPLQVAAEVDAHKALIAPQSHLRNVHIGESRGTARPAADHSAAAATWLSEVSDARFTQAYAAARKRLAEAHQAYGESVTQLQDCLMSMDMATGEEQDDTNKCDSGGTSGDRPGEAAISLDSGMRRALAQWRLLWLVPPPISASTKVSAAIPRSTDGRETLNSPSPVSSMSSPLPDADFHTLHGLVRRQLQLTEELKACDEAEREAETLRMLIHVYEQDLAASRERQLALHSAVRVRCDESSV